MDTTKEALVQVLKEADLFACEALSAFVHKIDMFDNAKGRFTGDLSFFEATHRIQTKLRLVRDMIEKEETL